VLVGCAGWPAGELADRLVESTLDAPGNLSGDDVAVLVIRMVG
jgi:hypothetical protein